MSIALIAQALNKINEVAASVATAITNIAGVKTTVDAARTDIASGRTEVTAARDNINNTTNAARDNVKTHVTNALAGISSSAIKSMQQVNVAPSMLFGSGGFGGTAYADIPCSAVNTNKAVLFPLRTIGASSSPLSYRLINSTTIRVEQFGSGTNPGGVGCIVVEFN